jgi:hypothetical protein
VVARAIARGVYEATALPVSVAGTRAGAEGGDQPLPAWRDAFGA